jgi:hypothetical protein
MIFGKTEEGFFCGQGWTRRANQCLGQIGAQGGSAQRNPGTANYCRAADYALG